MTHIARCVVLVCDGSRWHIRRLVSIEHDDVLNQKHYVCDKPISNDHDSLTDAMRALRRYLKEAAD